uniref:Uncharacterized protein n=1 Tax=Romanomermis culicivorax TaxID=13658 RepID=A0A915KYH6_ROMCU
MIRNKMRIISTLTKRIRGEEKLSMFNLFKDEKLGVFISTLLRATEDVGADDAATVLCNICRKFFDQRQLVKILNQ